MSAFCLLIVLLLLGSDRVLACDLEITVRPHAGEVTFGDPLYIEVTITNPGQEAISALPKDYPAGDRLSFIVHDLETHVQMTWHGQGAWAPEQFEPGRKVTFYQSLFLPSLAALDHRFWQPIRAGQAVRLSAVYDLRPGIALVSRKFAIRILPREEEELELLEEWVKADKGYTTGPNPSSFGIDFRTATPLEATSEIAPQISGELGSLLRFSQRFQETYALPRDSRDAKNRDLVEWLKKQPDIKRQTLMHQSLDMAISYNMPSTREALQKLIAEEKAKQKP